jgi:cytochrome P450
MDHISRPSIAIHIETAHCLDRVMGRRDDFVKPLDMLGMLNLYGPTITASEGEEHRAYRKAASPSFNESTHTQVWKEAIDQSRMMLDGWHQNDCQITDLNKDAAKLALNVLSKVFFNKMHWTDDAKSPPPGHTLTYSEAISSVFKYNNTLFMTPRPIISEF